MPRCDEETLARRGALSISRCAHCDTISLHVGGVSLRLEPEVLHHLWELIGVALSAPSVRRAALSFDRPRAEAS
ncbi:MAG: hypothetical protein JNM72_23500 [Deltaproteobacteria bacterium]|nr:hypothetical protein [Deltaproteobacteria bacterium]